MSLYNLIFGVENTKDLCLDILKISTSDVPRFRDAYLTMEDGIPFIVIHTRTGGGNREYYEKKNSENEDGPWNSDLESLPGYARNEDCSHDSTYANFYYHVPDNIKGSVIEYLNTNGVPMTPEEKFNAFIKSIK